MKFWMISGLHDPRWLGNIVANFARQKVRNKRLVIVENGAGIGVCRDNSGLLPKNVYVLCSEPGPAQPLNAALAWLRQHADPNDWFCKADSDDYYGPRYLGSIKPALGSDYAGRSSLYIRTSENKLWYVRGKPDAHVFHGPTIVGRVGSALDFPLVNDWGEDAEWCQAMHAAGKRCMNLAPEHVCYQRHANYEHTWPCSDYEIRTAWNAEFADLGAFDPKIVDGIKPRPAGTSLGIEPMTIENSMAVRVLLQKLNLRSLNG